MIKQQRVNGMEFYPGSLGADSDIVDRKKIQGESENIFKVMSKKIRAFCKIE